MKLQGLPSCLLQGSCTLTCPGPALVLPHRPFFISYLLPTGLPGFSFYSLLLVVATTICATMMDLSELGEAAAYLRKSYQEMVKVHTVPGDGKKWVWVPDEQEAYLEAEIKEIKAGRVTVETKDQKAK
ncbi:myosin-7B-like [Sarcophilus harrisii]|uniref:myosin-7B-like n=1 Tax=Sarcophilus harrisii TaxID=9305 RepID=UPI001301E68F|nr:myosin-7B-like [Sarcophilus harrisii]